MESSCLGKAQGAQLVLAMALPPSAAAAVEEAFSAALQFVVECRSAAPTTCLAAAMARKVGIESEPAALITIAESGVQCDLPFTSHVVGLAAGSNPATELTTEAYVQHSVVALEALMDAALVKLAASASETPPSSDDEWCRLAALSLLEQAGLVRKPTLATEDSGVQCALPFLQAGCA